MKRLILAGIGGYGNAYLEEIRRCRDEGRLALEAVVDPSPDGCQHLEWLRAEGVPIYDSLQDCLAHNHRADLAVVCTPSYTHEALACRLLEAGIPILCEKPLAPNVESAERILRMQATTGVFAAVGFQMCFSNAMRTAKRMVQSGALGAPRRLRSLVCWPRSSAYYTRNSYAGRICDPQGAPVLDSPAANAMAHFIHNMFFVLGRETGDCAWPVTLSAEAFRAYDIENFDTVALHGALDCGGEFLFLGSHVTAASREPHFEYEFEHGTLCYDLAAGPELRLHRHGGEVEELGSIHEYPDRRYFRKMHECLERAPGWENPAPLDSALPHLYVVEAIQRSLQGIVDFPAESVVQREAGGATWRSVAGLDAGLEDCFRSWRVPSQCEHFPFARAGSLVEVQPASAAT